MIRRRRRDGGEILSIFFRFTAMFRIFRTFFSITGGWGLSRVFILISLLSLDGMLFRNLLKTLPISSHVFIYFDERNLLKKLLISIAGRMRTPK